MPDGEVDHAVLAELDDDDVLCDLHLSGDPADLVDPEIIGERGVDITELELDEALELVRRSWRSAHGQVEPTPGMLAKAKRRLSKAGLTNYQLSIGSALAIDEPDASFDVLLNNYMFDLLDEHQWTQAITEFRRIMKPDGKLVLANMTRGEGLGSGLYERLYRLSPSLMGGCRGVRMSETLEHNGFSVQLREYVQQMLFPTEVILAFKSGQTKA